MKRFKANSLDNLYSDYLKPKIYYGKKPKLYIIIPIKTMYNKYKAEGMNKNTSILVELMYLLYK